LAEVSPETAEWLKGAPPLNYKSMAGQLTHLTLLPPLLYPNCRYYLKLYTLSDADKILPDFDTLSSWFRADDLFVYLSEAKKLLQELLSDVEFLSWQMQPCAACYTPWGKPMIDVLEYNQIYVAVGGNGGGAHPSDAIGKLAADLMLQNDWGSDLPREPFRLQFADEWGEWMHQLSFVWDK
jgi:glycine/D-amino acid oxidase-like deaminating enzyme